MNRGHYRNDSGRNQYNQSWLKLRRLDLTPRASPGATKRGGSRMAIYMGY